MGAKYLFYMKSIETHARAFLALIILPIGTVNSVNRGMPVLLLLLEIISKQCTMRVNVIMKTKSWKIAKIIHRLESKNRATTDGRRSQTGT